MPKSSMISSGHGGDRLHVLLARAVERSVGEFFEQDVRLAIQHVVALLNRGLADGLRQMAFAGAAGPEKQSVFAACR